MKHNKCTNKEWKREMGEYTQEGEFFRKGEIGDWRNHFAETEWKMIDELVDKNLQYKLKFKFKTDYANV